MKRIKSLFPLCVLIWIVASGPAASAVEPGGYRLLSVSESEKLVLVSQLSDQKKFLLDAAEVKVTVDDQPAEFKDLTRYSVVRVQMKLAKTKKNGVTLDGVATEITVKSPGK
ncbi:MAG: hypothetical protein LBP68_01905 [Acidobacteriota bacterium]|jgi:hypothetical protein|nr:hypothetical protein [Acidobacteriota bacterium]